MLSDNAQLVYLTIQGCAAYLIPRFTIFGCFRTGGNVCPISNENKMLHGIRKIVYILSVSKYNQGDSRKLLAVIGRERCVRRF